MLSVAWTMPGSAPRACAMAGMEGVYMDMVSAPSAVIAATSGVMAEGLIFDMPDVIGAEGGFAKLRRRFPVSALLRQRQREARAGLTADFEVGSQLLDHGGDDLKSQTFSLVQIEIVRQAAPVIRHGQFERVVGIATELHPDRAGLAAEGVAERVGDQFGRDQRQRDRQIR